MLGHVLRMNDDMPVKTRAMFYYFYNIASTDKGLAGPARKTLDRKRLAKHHKDERIGDLRTIEGLTPERRKWKVTIVYNRTYFNLDSLRK